MTHDEAQAQIGALFEGRAEAVEGAALRAHLAACADCRQAYDRAAVAMRFMVGTGGAMTAEELSLFQPPLPPAKVVPLGRPGRALALALAAALAGVVFYATVPKRDDGFAARKAAAVPEEAPSLRALCLRGDEVTDRCAAGDTLLFSATPRGHRHVTLYVGSERLGDTALAAAPDIPLPWARPFQAGLEVTAVFCRTEVVAGGACPEPHKVTVRP